jgi:hypothetical protein
MMRIRSCSIFCGIVVRREFEAARDAVNVGVNDYAFGFLNQVPSTTLAVLRATPGRVSSLSMSSGNLAAEIGDDFLRGADHGFGFVAEEAGGADVGLELFGRDCGESLDGRIFAEEFGRDAVHVYVGRLSGKDGRDQKFPCAGVGERAGDIGIDLVEALQDFGDAVGSEGIVGGLCFLSALEAGGTLPLPGRPRRALRADTGMIRVPLLARGFLGAGFAGGSARATRS